MRNDTGRGWSAGDCAAHVKLSQSAITGKEFFSSRLVLLGHKTNILV